MFSVCLLKFNSVKSVCNDFMAMKQFLLFNTFRYLHLYYFLNYIIVIRTHSDNKKDQFLALIRNINLGVLSPEHIKNYRNYLYVCN